MTWDWEHIVEMGITGLGASVPMIIYMWSNKRQAKADNERRAQEHQAILNEIVTERRYYPVHKHKERTGNLAAEGIDYPPDRG